MRVQLHAIRALRRLFCHLWEPLRITEETELWSQFSFVPYSQWRVKIRSSSTNKVDQKWKTVDPKMQNVVQQLLPFLRFSSH